MRKLACSQRSYFQSRLRSTMDPNAVAALVEYLRHERLTVDVSIDGSTHISKKLILCSVCDWYVSLSWWRPFANMTLCSYCGRYLSLWLAHHSMARGFFVMALQVELYESPISLGPVFTHGNRRPLNPWYIFIFLANQLVFSWTLSEQLSPDASPKSCNWIIPVLNCMSIMVWGIQRSTNGPLGCIMLCILFSEGQPNFVSIISNLD